MEALRAVTILSLVVLLLAGLPAQATDPFPLPEDPCTSVDEIGTGCTSPYAYADYLHLESLDQLPEDYNESGDRWKYSHERSGFPEVDNDPRELHGVTGMSIDLAWLQSTGRPDTVIAVLDSGIEWDASELAKKAYLNRGELPVPAASTNPIDPWDANLDGVFNVEDYRGQVTDAMGNGNGILDAGDLIAVFSNGMDDDGNGFVDDISGWNFVDDTNDPYDEVRYGHGTGEAEDSTGEAANGGGFPGVCPSCRFMPLRVGQSFIAHSEDYGQAVLYAVDAGASVVQEALGTVDGHPLAKDAHRYAWQHGVPLIASAADEAAAHHNLPSGHDHTINLNSIRTGGETNLAPRSFLYVNGCTNFGGNIYATVSSTSCSSEATGRGAGVAGLLISHARNLVDRGELDPHPGTDTFPSGSPLSVPEVRQLFRLGTDDIDMTTHREVVSPVPTVRYASQEGWDQYTGYGRLNVDKMLTRLSEGPMPTGVGFTAPSWWASFDALQQDTTTLVAQVDAHRAVTGPGSVEGTYTFEVGCGVQPTTWTTVEEGAWEHRPNPTVEAELNLDHVADACLITELPPVQPDQYQITVKVTAQAEGLAEGIDRRTLQVTRDPTLADGWPIELDGSMEASADVVDLDGDGVDEIVVPTTAGRVHALRIDGTELPGFPLITDPLSTIQLHTRQPAFTVGGLAADDYLDTISHGGTGIADLDGDGDLEIVATTRNGHVHAWHHTGDRMAGFPVATDPAYSDPAIRDPHNPLLPGIESAPVLADLDGDGDLEIIASALDRHLYAWHHTGAPVDGFPVLLVDRHKVTVDPVTHKVTPLPGVDAQRGGKIVSTPAVGDIDGDGQLEIVVGSNDHYADEPLHVSPTSVTSGALAAPEDLARAAFGDEAGDAADVLGTANGRLFAVEADGTYVDGWPVRVPVLIKELLPYVGEGVPGSPALGDLDGDGRDEIVIFATVGPVVVYRGDGTGFHGEDPLGRPHGLSTEAVGPLSGATDLPYLPGLGSPAIGELAGAGQPSIVVPAVGLGRALDVLLPGQQLVSQDYIMAYEARTGAPLPGYPSPMEDLQFLTTPAVVNVDADPLPEIVGGSATYLLHAKDLTGQNPPGFPKATNHWLIGTPAVGDLDGDGLRELVETSREGFLWVWHTDAVEATSQDAWWSDHRDEANTGRWTPNDPVELAGAELSTTDEPVRASPVAGLAAVVLTLMVASVRNRS